MEAESELIFGLDVGVTHTGLSWAEKAKGVDNIQVHTIWDWPESQHQGQGGNTQKVPTVIQKTDDGVGERWGYSVQPHDERYAFTKLQLENRLIPFVDGTGQVSMTEEPHSPSVDAPGQLSIAEDSHSPSVDTPGQLSIAEESHSPSLNAPSQLSIAEEPHSSSIDAPGQLSSAEESRSLNARTSEILAPTEILAEFLKHVRIHFFEALDQTYGGDSWKSLKTTLVVTFPAVWSEHAKAATLKAVEDAGFNESELSNLQRVISITEPEAVALYVFKDMKGTHGLRRMNAGDDFLVCDLGGGTSDLVAGRICAMDPITIKEIAPGIGRQCGSSFIDQRFILLLQKKLGDDWFRKVSGGVSTDELEKTFFSTLPTSLQDLVQRFSRALKCSFNGQDDKEHYPLDIPPSMQPAPGSVSGELRLTKQEMIELFKDTCDAVVQMIKEIFTRAPLIKLVIIVGGLGLNPYIRQKIEQAVKECNLQALVLNPPSAWSAVSKGAVYWGHEGRENTIIQERICRKHYGLSIKELYDMSKHGTTTTETCSLTKKKYATNRMRWLVGKGQSLSTNEPVHATYEVEWVFSIEEEAHDVEIEFKECDLDKPPSSAKDENVKLVGTLIFDLNKLPLANEAQKRTNNTSKVYRRYKFTIEVAITDRIRFSLTSGEQNYGGIDIEYNLWGSQEARDGQTNVASASD